MFSHALVNNTLNKWAPSQNRMIYTDDTALGASNNMDYITPCDPTKGKLIAPFNITLCPNRYIEGMI